MGVKQADLARSGEKLLTLVELAMVGQSISRFWLNNLQIAATSSTLGNYQGPTVANHAGMQTRERHHLPAAPISLVPRSYK